MKAPYGVFNKSRRSNMILDILLMVRAASVNWAINEVEKQEASRAAAVRGTGPAGVRTSPVSAEARALSAKKHLTTVMKIDNKQALDTLELNNEDDLRRLAAEQRDRVQQRRAKPAPGLPR